MTSINQVINSKIYGIIVFMIGLGSGVIWVYSAEFLMDWRISLLLQLYLLLPSAIITFGILILGAYIFNGSWIVEEEDK